MTAKSPTSLFLFNFAFYKTSLRIAECLFWKQVIAKIYMRKKTEVI